MAKSKINFGSIIIGFLTVLLLSYSLYNGLVRLEIITASSTLITVFLVIGAIIGTLFGFKYPVSTELISFAITALITVQASWDTIYDIQNGLQSQRVLVGVFAIAIFLLNMFTGKFKIRTARKQLKRTLGA